MSEEQSDKLQGPIIGISVLLEALLRTQSAAAMKAIAKQHHDIGSEVSDQLLNSQSSDQLLQTLRNHIEDMQERIEHIQRAAIVRDSAAGTL